MENWQIILAVGVLITSIVPWLVLRSYMKVTAQLRCRAYFDEDLGLPNARYFAEQLRRTVAWAVNNKRSFSLMAVGIDRLHEYPLSAKESREIILSVYGKLAQHLLPGDFLAVWRINRFCFQVIIPESGTEAATATAETILADVLASCRHSKMSLITLSIGVLGVEADTKLELSSGKLHDDFMLLRQQAEDAGGARVKAASRG